MKNLSFLFLLIISFLAFVFVSNSAHAAYFATDNQSPSISSPIQDDTFVAGNSVSVSAPINGELFSAGNTVSITDRVSRSVFAAGNTVTITNGAGYNVFAAGGTLTLKGTIDHDVYLAGQNITIDPSATIKGSVRIGGQNVNLAGHIMGDVYVSADSVRSSAMIDGNVKAESQHVTFTGGSIAKDFTYKSPQDAIGLSDVSISGTTQRNDLPSKTRHNPVGGFVFQILATFITGAALLLLVPRKIKEVSATVRSNWGQSFLYGLLALIVVPTVSFLVMITFIGIPIAFIALALYFIGLYISAVLGQIMLGQYVLDLARVKNTNSWVYLIVGVIVLGIIRLIPVVGGILLAVFFIALTLPTLGATLLWWKKILHQS